MLNAHCYQEVTEIENCQDVRIEGEKQTGIVSLFLWPLSASSVINHSNFSTFSDKRRELCILIGGAHMCRSAYGRTNGEPSDTFVATVCYY